MVYTDYIIIYKWWHSNTNTVVTANIFQVTLLILKRMLKFKIVPTPMENLLDFILPQETRSVLD